MVKNILLFMLLIASVNLYAQEVPSMTNTSIRPVDQKRRIIDLLTTNLNASVFTLTTPGAYVVGSHNIAFFNAATQRFTLGPLVLPYNAGGTGISTVPAAGQLIVGSGTGYNLRTLSGDATLSTAGALTLAASGATAGTYGQVTVDAKGRVTAGTAITSAANGGTAQSTYATGDLLYASAANTLSKRTIGTTGQVLTVVGGVPAWSSSAAAIDTTQLVRLTGNKPVAIYNNFFASTSNALKTGNGFGFYDTTTGADIFLNWNSTLAAPQFTRTMYLANGIRQTVEPTYTDSHLISRIYADSRYLQASTPKLSITSPETIQGTLTINGGINILGSGNTANVAGALYSQISGLKHGAGTGFTSLTALASNSTNYTVRVPGVNDTLVVRGDLANKFILNGTSSQTASYNITGNANAANFATPGFGGFFGGISNYAIFSGMPYSPDPGMAIMATPSDQPVYGNAFRFINSSIATGVAQFNDVIFKSTTAKKYSFGNLDGLVSTSQDALVSAAGTLTLAYGRDYAFNGSTATWTLPAVAAASTGRAYVINIKNRGTGNLTIFTPAATTDIYDSAPVSNISLPPGASVSLLPDGTYHNVRALSVPGRQSLPVTANATMVLNADYLNTTATQYTLTLPPTTGFAADGSKIITVLASGTGGLKIAVPSGYSLQSGNTFATTTGTGGTTLTQGTKAQLIPMSSNSYYLQPLNGTITLY